MGQSTGAGRTSAASRVESIAPTFAKNAKVGHPPLAAISHWAFFPKFDSGAQLLETGVGRAWIGVADANFVGLGISLAPSADTNNALALDSPSYSFIGFRYSPVSASDTNWQCVSNNNGTQTIVDSGVAADTAFHKFTVSYSVGTLTFSLDGNTVATITTNLPDTSQIFGPIVWADNVADAADTFCLLAAFQRWFLAA
ncbi:MAG: hypothetical protein WB952_12435 [Terriglobales bacterium]